ncbi:MAG: GNAT family N-acetyltransferase, partial [Gammaproteobacteria bacterium]
MTTSRKRVSETLAEQYGVEPDYSDPSTDDFEALSRDRIFVRSLRSDDLDAVVRIDSQNTGRDRLEYFRRK